VIDTITPTPKASYVAQLARSKGLAVTFELELFRLNALWGEFRRAGTDAEAEAALEAAIRFEVALAKQVEQAPAKRSVLDLLGFMPGGRLEGNYCV
jgi:hypothetical protein